MKTLPVTGGAKGVWWVTYELDLNVPPTAPGHVASGRTNAVVTINAHLKLFKSKTASKSDGPQTLPRRKHITGNPTTGPKLATLPNQQGKTSTPKLDPTDPSVAIASWPAVGKEGKP